MSLPLCLCEWSCVPRLLTGDIVFKSLKVLEATGPYTGNSQQHIIHIYPRVWLGIENE